MIKFGIFCEEVAILQSGEFFFDRSVSDDYRKIFATVLVGRMRKI